MTHRLTLFAALCFASTLTLSLGCGGSGDADKSETTKPTESAESKSEADSKTNSVAAAKATDATSPAAGASNLPSPDATAQEVCQRFMNLMRTGNRIAAENLLTKSALNVTTRAGLQLEPMGGPTAEYNVGEVRYATTKQKLAQVDCTIVDNVDGEKYEMNVTWLVRKQKLGWRISGVMLELESGQVPDLLSFENIHDVTKIKNMAGEDVIDEAETRQADASDFNIK